MVFSISDSIWDFGKLPLPLHLGKFLEDFGKINPKYTKLGKYRPFLIGNGDSIRR